MFKKMKNLNKQKGITLVALIITIIVLIILAGITLSITLGNNGIFKKSQKAVDEYKGAVKKEQEQLEGVYDDLRGPLATDGSYNEEKKINTPVIKSDENTKMELVKYDEEKQEWITDTNNSSYDYVEETGTNDNTSSKWANAKITKNGVDSYFVWIPRFAYKITYYKDENKTGENISTTQTQYGTIDVKFIKGTGKEAVDGTQCKYAEESATKDDYIVHPAFTKNADLGGGWEEELPGLWVGKYETSLIKISNGEAITSDTNIVLQNGADTTIDKALAIQPNKGSWRNIKIGNMYDNARNYEEKLQSHMLKNSEWGAVAYLTHSQYGRNGYEIDINNSSDYITGNGGGNPNAEEAHNTINAYNSPEGMKASSTGNIYGIYDLSGGAMEYVAAYYSGSDVNERYLNNGSSFASKNGTSNKYATAYSTTTAKKGDTTTETKNWNGDSADFVFSGAPFFERGGLYRDSSNSGVFCYGNHDSGGVVTYSFRVCLAM